MKYFKDITNLSALRKQYKELLKVHHPDNGGNIADIQEINAEYDKLFKMPKDKHDSKATDSDKTSFDNMQYDLQKMKSYVNCLIRLLGFMESRLRHAATGCSF